MRRSLEIKAAMVERDEFDRGPRCVFNYGHSFGHALESATGYRIPHGVAVGFGMDVANVISCDLGLLGAADRNRLRAVIAPVLAGTEPAPVDLERFFAALARDKKNEGAQVKVILSRGVGDMVKTGLDLTAAVRERIADYFTARLWTRDL